MKALIDTNIILDIALNRQPSHAESQQILFLIYHQELEGYISASTFSDIYYIVSKQIGPELSWDFLKKIVTFCQVATADGSVIEMALDSNSNVRDIEDAIQRATAIVNQLDVIVTNTPHNFPVETPRILTPGQLIQELNSSQKAAAITVL